MGRPRDREIVLSETERDSLLECARSRSAPHGLVRRARIVLASASGRSNTEIAREPGISVPSVCLWRNRFLAQGLVGLYGEQRPGWPRRQDDEAVAALLSRVLRSRPANGTHWTFHGAAAFTGIPKTTVHAIFGCSGYSLIGPATSSCQLIPSFSRSPRHGWAISKPARTRLGPLRRGEEQDSSAGTHTTDAANGPRLR